MTRVLSVEGWGLVFFDWFILSMRMQVILSSSFRPPGFSPYKGWEEEESSGTGLSQNEHTEIHKIPKFGVNQASFDWDTAI